MIFSEPAPRPNWENAGVLHDPTAHEAPEGGPWGEPRVRTAIRLIVADAKSTYDRSGAWPLHPVDAGEEDDDWAGVSLGVYLGAAGMLWGLDRLAREGAAELSIDPRAGAADLHEAYLARCHVPDEPMPSIWLGESGVLLVAELLAPQSSRADALLDVVRGNARNETLELLWGAPGTMLAAREMYRRTGEERWADAWRESAAVLLEAWRVDDEAGCRLWTHVIGGKADRGLGAVHGFAGNILSLAAGLDLLPEQTRAEIVRDATRTVVATAVVENGAANWPTSIGRAVGQGGTRSQWCHGAPGIVGALASLPREAELDALLLAGGELVWQAGPLVKGAGLCHGTAGTGLALLALFGRTGDEIWLERARTFAMHALAQVERQREAYGHGWFSLWTGDLGTALYAWQCLDGDAALPALTSW